MQNQLLHVLARKIVFGYHAPNFPDYVPLLWGLDKAEDEVEMPSEFGDAILRGMLSSMVNK